MINDFIHFKEYFFVIGTDTTQNGSNVSAILLQFFYGQTTFDLFILKYKKKL